MGLAKWVERKVGQAALLLAGAVNGFRERTFVSLSRTIERIQAKIKREKSRLKG